MASNVSGIENLQYEEIIISGHRSWTPGPLDQYCYFGAEDSHTTAHAPQLTKEALNMSEVFKVPAPVSEIKRRLKRPLSPQPSTSSAPCPPLPPLDPELVNPSVNPVKQLLDSVYAHVADETFRLNDVGQLRGLKSGRRRGRWRKIQQAKLALKYTEAIKVLEPLLMEEIVKQQSQHVLITSALDHFANTVNGIVDKFEGKTDTEYTRRLEAFKKKAVELREKRRARNPNAAEFLDGPPPPKPKLSEEETNRRLREETEAAVEAILTGDKTKETLPNNFAQILKAFKMA